MGSEVRQYLHITCDPLIELEVKEGKGPTVLMTDSRVSVLSVLQLTEEKNTMLHGSVGRVILFPRTKHTIVMLLHYLLLHLELILFKFFKALFLSTSQGVES